MTLINSSQETGKTVIEENTTTVTQPSFDHHFVVEEEEEEVPTLTIEYSPSPPPPFLSLNLQINSNYYNSISTETSSQESPSLEQSQASFLESQSFRSVSTLYFQQDPPTITIEEEEMMNASNSVQPLSGGGAQPAQQENPYAKSQMEFVIQEPSVPYSATNDNLVTPTPYDSQEYVQEYQQVEYVNPNHYSHSPMVNNHIQPQIIYDLPRETSENQQTMIHTPVDIEAHHIKVDEAPAQPRNLIEWLKTNRLLALFIVLDVILFFYSAVLVIVNSAIHIVLCLLTSILPFVLVKRRAIFSSFVLGAMFIDMVTTSVFVWHIMEEQGEWNAWKVILIFVLYIQQILTFTVGCIIVYKINQERRANDQYIASQ